MNFEQFPPNVRTFLKLAQSFEKSDPVIGFHCCEMAKQLYDKVQEEPTIKQQNLVSINNLQVVCIHCNDLNIDINSIVGIPTKSTIY